MQNLYRAFFSSSKPHVLLGRRLRPFSYWHLLQLQHAASPLIGYPGEPDLAALAVAASICVTRFDRNFAAPRGWEIYRHQRAVRRAARAERFFMLELKSWVVYLRDGTSRPQMFQRKSAKACQCPTPLAVVSALMSRGVPEAEAWDKQVGRAAWYKVALAEADGAELGLMTDAARAAMTTAGWGHLIEEAA